MRLCVAKTCIVFHSAKTLEKPEGYSRTSLKSWQKDIVAFLRRTRMKRAKVYSLTRYSFPTYVRMRVRARARPCQEIKPEETLYSKTHSKEQKILPLCTQSEERKRENSFSSFSNTFFVSSLRRPGHTCLYVRISIYIHILKYNKASLTCLF